MKKFRFRYKLAAPLLVAVWVCACGSAFAPSLKKAPEIQGEAWFNIGKQKKPETNQFLGKVVLIFFWSANDLNCQADIPVLNDWYAKYKDKGLEIIGVHSFEWGFDASDSVLFDKILSFHIEFPVVSNDSLSTERAYEQFSMPSYCLVDRSGFIRGRYKAPLLDTSLETMIEALLEQGRPRMSEEEA